MVDSSDNQLVKKIQATLLKVEEVGKELEALQWEISKMCTKCDKK